MSGRGKGRGVRTRVCVCVCVHVLRCVVLFVKVLSTVLGCVNVSSPGVSSPVVPPPQPFSHQCPDISAEQP